jgi:hypothetical protein
MAHPLDPFNPSNRWPSNLIDRPDNHDDNNLLRRLNEHLRRQAEEEDIGLAGMPDEVFYPTFVGRRHHAAKAFLEKADGMRLFEKWEARTFHDDFRQALNAFVDRRVEEKISRGNRLIEAWLEKLGREKFATKSSHLLPEMIKTEQGKAWAIFALENGAVGNFQGLRGACYVGDEALVKAMLKSGVSANGPDQVPACTDLPLSYKVNESVPNRNEVSLRIKEILLKQGADINRLPLSQSLLARAVTKGNTDEVKWLLAHGADPSLPISSVHSTTSLEIAKSAAHDRPEAARCQDVFKLLQAHQSPATVSKPASSAARRRTSL